MTAIFEQIEHKCTTVQETFPPRKPREGFCDKLKKFWFSLILVSPQNSLTIQHFSSEYQIRHERRRQYYSPNYFIIHPLSKLAALYDAYLCLFYITAIFFKLVEVAFIRRSLMGTKQTRVLAYIVSGIDSLSWFNLILLCFEGIIVSKQKLILINFRGIVLYRLTSVAFWTELVASVPKCIICSASGSCSSIVWLFLTISRLFILCHCQRPIPLLKQTLGYLRIESRPVLLIVHLSYLLAFVTHVMACTGFAISRYRYAVTGAYQNNSWILYGGLINKRISIQYCYAFFKASAQTFGITIEEFDDSVNWEESIIAIMNYAVGKIIYIVMWVALLHVLLAQNLQTTKFQEIISQLKHWMENKDLPRTLQNRIVEYYHFYYRKKFFSKKQVQRVMPESLGAKVRINMYTTLKKSNIALFGKLSEDDIQKLGGHFVTEVYSPNEIILYSGTKGESLYLLASGSVAVYSHSGKEVCHLHDGAYFGELSLLIKDQKVTATIIAIETTKIYRIGKKYFDRYILTKAEIRDMFLIQAEERLKAIREVEEEYRKTLFAQMYQK